MPQSKETQEQISKWLSSISLQRTTRLFQRLWDSSEPQWETLPTNGENLKQWWPPQEWSADHNVCMCVITSAVKVTQHLERGKHFFTPLQLLFHYMTRWGYLWPCPAPHWDCYEAEGPAGEEAETSEPIPEEEGRKLAGSAWPMGGRKHNL